MECTGHKHIQFLQDPWPTFLIESKAFAKCPDDAVFYVLFKATVPEGKPQRRRVS